MLRLLLAFSRGGLALLLVFANAAAVELEGRTPIPCVVNPVFSPQLSEVLRLDGVWEFATDPKKRGEAEKWFEPQHAWSGCTNIAVPGCWEAQGIGGPGRSLNTTPEQVPAMLRGNYVGSAWYRKRVQIPSAWAGKEVWLKLGGVNSQGWFYVNGNYVGHLHSFCGTYKFQVTDLVRPGQEATVVALVRNDVPSAKGLMNWVHRFGGLYRSVELEATPGLLIDDLYTEPLFDQQSARVHVFLRNGNPGQVPADCAVEVRVSTLPGVGAGSAQSTAQFLSKETSEVILDVPVNPFKAWSPEHPVLYRADAYLTRAGQKVHHMAQRFGLRKWEVRGADLYLNNQRFFLRGFGDDYIYPLTLCSPASRETHLQHLWLARQYGFNFVRHHTHCELPEFFEAAEEAGIMVQPEMPYYGPAASGGKEVYRPRQDAEELVRHFRRYVCLANYCTGNEGQLTPPLDAELFQYFRQIDPARIAIHQDGGVNTPQNSHYGFFSWLGDIGTVHDPNHPEARTVAAPGVISMDYSRPLVIHEYLNLATDEDPRVSDRYVGAVLPPRPMEGYGQELAKAGLPRAWGDRCLEAAQRQQSLWQKVGVEGARRDPRLDGMIFWTLIDVGYPTAQGLLNQFWEPKHSTPEFFQQFNTPVVVLAELTPKHRILSARDTLEAQWFISNYSGETLADDLAWRLVDATGATLARGEIKDVRLPHGAVPVVGTSKIVIPELQLPTKAALVAELKGHPIHNAWEVWLFPSASASAAGKSVAATPEVFTKLRDRYPDLVLAGAAASERRVLLSDRFGAAELAALNQGRRVICLGARGPAPGYVFGWWGKSAQTGTAISNWHPAFGGFPADDYLTPVFHRILGRAEKLGGGRFKACEPLMVTVGSSGYLAHVLQLRSRQGRLLLTGLDLLADTPEATWLLNSFIHYATSEQFQPEAELDQEQLREFEQALASFNGVGHVLKSSEQRPYRSPTGDWPMHIARATDGLSEVVWETKAVPAQLDKAGRFTLTWLGGTGYISASPGAFNLFLGEKPLLQFEVTRQPKRWSSADGLVQLDYAATDQTETELDSAGFMKLTLPAAWLTPGKPATLRVVGDKAGSPRWFGLYETD